MQPNDLEDYFIPNKRNNYAPHGLQKVAMLAMVVLVVLSFTVANLHSLIWIGSNWMVSTILPAVIVDLTNDQRKDQALSSLRRNPLLDEAARMKAEHMASQEYFAHYSPDGVSPWFWFGRAQYNFVHAGENLAIHFTDSGEVVEAWMDSPTHRANIMNGNYSEIGVGTAEGTYEGFATVYVVQMFGTPAAAEEEEIEEPAVEETIAATESEQEEVVLAEAVSLTEDVEVFEAEPVLVAVTEEVEPAPSNEVAGAENELATSSEATSSPSLLTEKEIMITRMEDTPYGVALYSDLISTSTGGVPATIDGSGPGQRDQAPFFFEIATQPHIILQIMYSIIGVFVVSSLLVSILIEIRRQHPIQIAYGGALLAIMAVLYYVHVAVSGGALIV